LGQRHALSFCTKALCGRVLMTRFFLDKRTLAGRIMTEAAFRGTP
jgi:hypothetical protein